MSDALLYGIPIGMVSGLLTGWVWRRWGPAVKTALWLMFALTLRFTVRMAVGKKRFARWKEQYHEQARREHLQYMQELSDRLNSRETGR